MTKNRGSPPDVGVKKDDPAEIATHRPAKRFQPKSFLPQGPDARPANAWDQLQSISNREAPASVDEEALYQIARATMKSRRLRARFLPGPMFGEPAWDMLLALYIVDKRGARETISKLCLSSGAPATTALRWLEYLQQHKLVARRQSSTDRRVVFIDLTDSGREAVESYFLEISKDLRATP